ncbi:MFS domain-containing protein, partial [Haematococcus lacustris]
MNPKHPKNCPPGVLKGDASIRGSRGRVLLGSGPVIELDLPANMLGGWAPFNGPNGQSMLGEVDLAFLGAYAIGMFFAGHLGDRLDLR